jgi:hypothetical protein
MPSLVQRQHDAYAARARLRGLAPPVDQDAIDDREWAELMLATPSHYPAYRGMSLEQVVRIVRSWRLNAEVNRGTKRSPRLARKAAVGSPKRL